MEEDFDGSPGSNVDLPGRGRGRQENAKERAFVSAAEQISDFRESHLRAGQIALRRIVARGVNNIRERCALLSQQALESVIASADWSVAVRNLVAGSGIFGWRDWRPKIYPRDLNPFSENSFVTD